MLRIDSEELVERLWARDATLWTGQDEAQWLGWLDEPARYPREQMAEGLDSLRALQVSSCVLLGMRVGQQVAHRRDPPQRPNASGA